MVLVIFIGRGSIYDLDVVEFKGNTFLLNVPSLEKTVFVVSSLKDDNPFGLEDNSQIHKVNFI